MTYLPNSMMYNTRYKESCWKDIQDQVGPMNDVINHTNTTWLDPPMPPCDTQKNACPYYNIKGL